MKKSPFDFHHDYRSLPFPRTRLERLADRLAKGEKIAPTQKINVVLCSDYKIRKLNRQYRGKDRATDVLSFPFGESDLLGEIYISLQRMSLQAKRYGLSYGAELERLLVHGFIHLLGYDHKTERERTNMIRRERRYCRSGISETKPGS